VRGVTFQPIQAAGPLEHFNPSTDRLTLTEVRRNILEQTSVFRPEDLPVPCHPDCLAMGYALMEPCREAGDRHETQRKSRGDYSATLGNITAGPRGVPSWRELNGHTVPP